MIENLACGISKTPEIEVNDDGLITATAGSKSSEKQLPTKTGQIYTPTTTSQTIKKDVYLTGNQTIKGDANLKSTNILSGKSIFGVQGTVEAVTTPVIDVSISGLITATAGSKQATEQLPIKSAATYTPTTTDQYIYTNNYITGIQTIKGDPNLVPSNIVSGKSIFGVAGTAEVASGYPYKEWHGSVYPDDMSNLTAVCSVNFNAITAISFRTDPASVWNNHRYDGAIVGWVCCLTAPVLFDTITYIEPGFTQIASIANYDSTSYMNMATGTNWGNQFYRFTPDFYINGARATFVTNLPYTITLIGY